MFRRSRKSTSPLRRKQQQIARQEAELREKLEKLERMVKGGAIGRNRSSAQTTQRSGKGKPEKHLQVSMALDGRQLIDASRTTRKPRALRKQRREGQMIFLFLLGALAFAVIWLISHLHF